MKRGDIVDYTLTDQDADRVAFAREHQHATARPAGAGDTFPMLVVAVNDEAGTVDGRVFLNGADDLWVVDHQADQDEAGTTSSTPAGESTDPAATSPESAHSYPATDPATSPAAPASSTDPAAQPAAPAAQ